MNLSTSCRRFTGSRVEPHCGAQTKAQPLVVGIGDCKVSADPAVELITYALGSCIALAIWDPVSRVGGMLHFMLPESSTDLVSSGRENPYRYADTGTPMLFRNAYQHGADKRRLVVRMAGGAAVVDSDSYFNIGKRNYAAVRKILWKAGLVVHGEDVGGTDSRTVRLEVGSGRLFVCGPETGEKELRAPGRQTMGGGQ